MVVLLRQHALNLHVEHHLELGRWRHQEELWRVLLHPVILLQHFERFIDVKLLRPQESQEKSFILSSFVAQIAAGDETLELLEFR